MALNLINTYFVPPRTSLITQLRLDPSIRYQPHERHEREPEQKVQVRPQNLAVDAVGGGEHVVVVVPVDAEVDETEDVSQEDGQDGTQRLQVRAARDAEFEHHDRDQYRDHAVAERFQTPFIHRPS